MKQFLTITEADDKTTQAGKPYTRFKTNLGWMSSFDSEVITSIKANLHKKLELETQTSPDGKWTSISNMWAVADDKTLPLVMTESEFKAKPESNSRDKLIVRQSSLKAAIEYSTTEHSVVEILNIAEAFEAWVNR